MAYFDFNFLNSMFPATEDEILNNYVDPLNSVCENFAINTDLRIAGFISQVGHESGGLRLTKENLNYSAERLRVVFPKYFPTDALAAAYARQPEKIANRVYASRIGNGPEGSGDGWRFRGRGLMQLTGRANYTQFANAVSMSLDDVPEYLETFDGAAMVAGWFWSTRDLNRFADRADVVGMTRTINGGTHGLEDRRNLYNKAMKLLR